MDYDQKWLEDVIYTKEDGHPFVPDEYLEGIMKADDPIKSAREWIYDVCDGAGLRMPPSDWALTLAARYVTKELTIAEMIFSNAVSVDHASNSVEREKYELDRDDVKETYKFNDGSKLVFQEGEMWVSYE